MLIAFPCIGSYLMPRHLFDHFMQLVNAVTILSQKEIPRPQVQVARVSIEKFSSQVNKHYGCSMQSFNVHQSRHLVADVNRFGPMWTHSAFIYESKNHDVLQVLHGSNKLLEQLVCFQQVQDTLSTFREQQPVNQAM